MSEDVANDIIEAVLTKLSKVPVVGDALEEMSNEEYDNLQNELIAMVEKMGA